MTCNRIVPSNTIPGLVDSSAPFLCLDLEFVSLVDVPQSGPDAAGARRWSPPIPLGSKIRPFERCPRRPKPAKSQNNEQTRIAWPCAACSLLAQLTHLASRISHLATTRPERISLSVRYGTTPSQRGVNVALGSDSVACQAQPVSNSLFHPVQIDEARHGTVGQPGLMVAYRCGRRRPRHFRE
jgi:hypothetical protein